MVYRKKPSRFWKNVEIKGVDDCWLWTGYIDDRGHGTYAGKMATRTAMMLSGEDVGRKEFVLHKCKNVRCVNPKHLFKSVSILQRTSAESRFWTKVDKRGPDECWLWTAHVNNKGYGMLDRTLASRLSMMFTGEVFGPKECALHKCDTPRCVNPKHLFKGTQAENLEDMTKKGRRASGRCGTSPDGELNGKSKITRSIATEMRRNRSRRNDASSDRR